ncbi:unnamed protein product [Sympodiomycopsis kandeliae]
MSTSFSTPSSSSRPQRVTSGRNASRVTSYAEQDNTGDDDSGQEDEEDEDEDQDIDDDDDDHYARLQGAVARHRQVAALAAGEAYTPDSKSRRLSSAHKHRSSSSNQKRISKARIEAIENVVLPDQGDTGWMSEPANPQEAPHIFAFILHTIKTYVSRSGRKLAEAIDNLPNDPAFQRLSEAPVSLSDIELKASQGLYQASRAFEHDMLIMFKAFRRGYPLGSQPYADVMILQRLYQRLTRTHTHVQNISVHTVMENYRTADASHNFASVPFGPGEATRGQASDLTTRPVIRGKTYYTHAHHKGYTFRVGDWVHLMNATDPGKPIVAQVFKICKRDDEKNEPPLLSCCWYYRPEQTVHPPSRRFVAEEVFKTGLFADHPVDDVIEKVHILFYTKWTRGRPGPKDWDPQSPLYFVESRYNEKTLDFNKIKNWNSCLPEELRGSEPQVILFPEAHPQPNRIESPFLRGIKGPGRLCDEDEVGRGETLNSRTSQEIPDPFVERPRKKIRTGNDYPLQPQGNSPSASHLPGGFSPATNPMRGSLQSSRPIAPAAPPGAAGPQVLMNAQMTISRMNTILPDKIGRMEFNRLSQLFANPIAARNIDLHSLSASLSGKVDLMTLTKWRDAMQVFTHDWIMRNNQSNHQPQPPVPTGTTSTSHQTVGIRPPVIERSLSSALLGMEAWWEDLSPETIQLFSDHVASANEQEGEEEKVKWFPGPPLYSVRQGKKKKPVHSLKYLTFLAEKQKSKGDDPGQGQGQGQEEDAEDDWKQVYGLQNVWEDIPETADETVDGENEDGEGEGEGEGEIQGEESAETEALAKAILQDASA